MPRSFLLLSSALLLGCGKPAPSDVPNASFLHFDAPEGTWASRVEYRSGGSVPELVLDGVVFRLVDPAAYRIDWKALGISGVKVTNASFESTTPAPEGFFAVDGRAVEIAAGVLRWGDEAVGPVSAGTHVRVERRLTIE